MSEIGSPRTEGLRIISAHPEDNVTVSEPLTGIEVMTDFGRLLFLRLKCLGAQSSYGGLQR